MLPTAAFAAGANGLPFAVCGLDCPFAPVGRLPSSLYTFPVARAWLGITGLHRPQSKASPNLAGVPQELPPEEPDLKPSALPLSYGPLRFARIFYHMCFSAIIASMKKLPDYFQLERFNITPADVIRMAFHCDPDAIRPDVILMPWWQPTIFNVWTDRITINTESILFEMEYAGKPVSIVRSGIGAPQTGDVVLALGCTACERIFFAGSVGGLRADFRIGDLLIPEFSVSGDGFCRYLQPGFPTEDRFLERVLPDEALTLALSRSAAPLAREAGVVLHTGPVFSIDTILAQFGRLDTIVEKLGCIGIEMETAAVFKAARLVGIQATALLSVSDVPVRNKSLYAGRSEDEKENRRQIRKKVLAKILLDTIIQGV